MFSFRSFVLISPIDKVFWLPQRFIIPEIVIFFSLKGFVCYFFNKLMWSNIYFFIETCRIITISEPITFLEIVISKKKSFNSLNLFNCSKFYCVYEFALKKRENIYFFIHMKTNILAEITIS